MLRERAVAWAVAEMSVDDINARGLGWANVEIFRRLVDAVDADGYCCDGNLRIPVSRPLHSLVAGDRKVPAVSAASIIAKVHRDALMTRMHDEAPYYNWASNKGYGAPEHRAAIREHGPHPAHRRVFLASVMQTELDLTGSVAQRDGGASPPLERAEPRSVGAAAAAAAATSTAAPARDRRLVRTGSRVDRDPADQRHAGPALAARADGGDFAIGHRTEQLEHGRAVVAAVFVERHHRKRTHDPVDLTSRTSVRYKFDVMPIRTIELQLPLDADEAGSLARRRVSHLAAVDGLEPAAFVKLIRSFPSLRSIYTASEPELARLVGPVAAARIRWFLDAPLDTALAREASPDQPPRSRAAAFVGCLILA